jgi:hypothetical protein
MIRCQQCECIHPDGAISCDRCGYPLLSLVDAGLPHPSAVAAAAGSSAIELWPADEPDDPIRCDAPAMETHHDRSGKPFARPASPDFPMNENASDAQVVHATIPATDRADKSPTPPPAPSIRPKLVVLRGMKIDTEYPVYEGRNTVGRFADKPVDIDLVSQESNEQIWCSRQHAVVLFDKGNVSIEDLNSLNGTWVNGVRIYAGQPRQLRPGDVVQIGTVQMKLVMG